MPAEAGIAEQKWLKLPSGLYVSTERMQKDGEMFVLYNVSHMDIEAFNAEADPYDVHLKESDSVLTRLINYSILLSRRDNDGSFIPTKRKYLDMSLDVAAANAKGEEPLASFYNETLTNAVWDVVREILEFKGKVETGLDKGKHKAMLLRFDENGELVTIDDDILIPGEGWIRVLEPRHGYPIETSEERCSVENIGNSALRGSTKGYFDLGKEPEKGEQRLVLCRPRQDHNKILSTRVSEDPFYSGAGMAALRMKRKKLKDYSQVRVTVNLQKRLDQARLPKK